MTQNIDKLELEKKLDLLAAYELLDEKVTSIDEKLDLLLEQLEWTQNAIAHLKVVKIKKRKRSKTKPADVRGMPYS